MGRIEIIDDCLEPERYVYLTYRGPNPWEVAKQITAKIRPFFHVSASGTNNTRLNWDVAGDPIKFYSTWWARRKLSHYTIARFFFKINGSKSKTKDEGEFVIEFYGQLETEIKGWSLLLWPFWLTYSYLFYNRARRNYLRICQSSIYNFRNELKEHYKLETNPVPSKVGTYQ